MTSRSRPLFSHRTNAHRIAAVVALFFVACVAETPERNADGAQRPDVSGVLDATSAADGRQEDGGVLDDVGPDAAADVPTVFAGPAEQYAEQCATCHGSTGQGGQGPALAGWLRPRSTLVRAIDTRMPQFSPALCVGECAEAMADYILSWTDLDCDDARTSPRAMRLLTRREYDNSVQALIAPAARSCTTDSACENLHEHCDSGECVALPCGTVRFAYEGPASTVHVAGTFNDWASTVATGGYALANDGENRWSATVSVAPGRHEYKLVVNESDWLADPMNPLAADDGFGGSNSVLDADCESVVDSGWSAGLPSEVRPEGFPFATHAASGHVSPAHVDVQLETAARAAALVSEDLRWLACTSGDACARQFLGVFGRRAWRRPLTPDELEAYTALILSHASFRVGVQRAVEQLLMSPYFLYRMELGALQTDGTYLLDAWERASVLSYMFWGTTPDDRLLDAAARGDLDTPEGMRAEAARLLDAPEAREGVAVFTEQWLGIEAVESATRDQSRYPDFDNAARAALREETRRLVTHVIFDGTGRLPELYDADYTIANAALARLYGWQERADGWQLLPYADDRRSGILGHASVLTATAHSDQTSPIRRGLWVRQRLLCQPFGTPPANAGGVPDVDPTATTRERFRQHTDDPFCASCHQYIDDLGFGFEHYDPVGVWRDAEPAGPIDASGNLNDVEGFGTDTQAPFRSLTELATIITSSQSASACFVRQYARFSSGREETPADLCTLRDLEREFVAADLDIRSLMLATATHPSVLRRH